MTTITIPARIKTSAIKSIIAVDSAYFAPDGIVSLENQAGEKRDGIAATIFKLAKQVRKNNDDLNGTIRMFQAACIHAENEYKAQYAVTNIAEHIPAWSQFKSRLIRAMKNGIDPADYNSERAMRDALQDALPLVAANDPKSGEARGKALEPADIAAWVERTAVPPSLQLGITRLIVGAEYLKVGTIREANAILAEAAAKIGELINGNQIESAEVLDILDRAA